MRHIVGFACLFVFFLLTDLKSNSNDGTLSDLTVFIYLAKCLVVYFIGYFLYTPVYRAWIASKG